MCNDKEIQLAVVGKVTQNGGIAKCEEQTAIICDIGLQTMQEIQ
jgi:hypothetical protein